MYALTEEQRETREWAREFAARFVEPVALELDADPGAPAKQELVRQAARAGVLAMCLPEPLGGAGRSAVAGVLFSEEIAAACAGCCLLFSVNGLAFAPIWLSGDLQKLPRFVQPIVESWETDAPRFAALACTEPSGASDIISGHPDGRVATRVEESNGGLVINGRKTFISNGDVADWVVVFASHDTSAPVRESLSAVIVPTETPGFSVGQTFDKMGQRVCSCVELVFDDVWVPADHLVGKPGTGWTINRNIMGVTRSALAGLAVGIARSAYDKALAYARVRVQGGMPIVRQQAIQVMLADMAIRVEAARALALQAARAVDSGAPSLRLSSMAKTFASDIAVANAVDAIQVLGGYGYMREYGVEKLLRDAKITQIYEGTNQVNRFEIMEQVEAESHA